MEIQNFKLAYTFDDIQIVPLYSDITSRSLCNLETYITKNYKINIPFISAPMDTVTELEMINKIQMLGGIGAPHRFGSAQIDLYKKLSTYF